MLPLKAATIWCMMTMVNTLDMCLSEKRTANVVTFNTALGTLIPFYDQRRQSIKEALLSSDADVICLNEIWYAKDMIEIQRVLRKKFPYSFSTIHNDDKMLLGPESLATPPCEASAFARVLQCVIGNCNQSNPFAQAICFSITCNGFRLLSAECTACVFISGASRAAEQCVTRKGAINAFTGPGLAMFSKFPMSFRAARDLQPGVRRLIPRWLLSAKVKGLGTVGCTHLTVKYPGPYIDPVSPPLFSSYEEENLNNTLEILKCFQYERRAIIMGDFNQSPLRRGLIPELPNNYNKFLVDGLVNPYVDNVGLGTHGSVNPLSYPQDGPYILDHIFHRGLTALYTKRTFDKLTYYGGNITIPLSDHYGVSVTFRRNCRRRPINY